VITNGTPESQINQIKSYLIQLSEELEYQENINKSKMAQIDKKMKEIEDGK
jgi:hypothetical protein